MVRIFCTAILLLWSSSVLAANAVSWPTEPEIHAKSWILLDARSGQVLAQHAETMHLPPASMTKMMTLYLAFEALKRGSISMDQRANVSDKAWKIGGSTMFLEPRMHPQVRELLHGIATLSGNDAAITMAELISGNENDFAALMNDKAAALGMQHSHFDNATGFPTENHYSSALDMAKLGVALWRDFPDYYKIFSEKSYTYDGRTQWNRNRLLWTMPEATGLKTGHTEDAGFCMTGATERGYQRLVSVVFGADSKKARLQESERLLRYGLDRFITLTPSEKDIRRKIEVFEGKENSVGLKAAQDVWISVPKGSEKMLSFHLTYESPQLAPIQAGQQLGSIEAVLRSTDGDVQLKVIPMIAESSVERASWLGRKYDTLRLWWQAQQ
ncbi:MAG: D-alanyl-D-alanine carboxypeptidase [Zetaproteobacteria bacterium CG2_30_46_52]|nr:MAG: D-alanyl-D-alanine carboxypeptidase [Zetaproteobacteria bacterium CG2_30_46_52]